jgi:uncharacterized protein (TIGR03437 family)
LTADGAGFEPGVYRATIAIQSPNTTPQVTNIPVMFVLGASTSGTQITGTILYGSQVPTASPGTLYTLVGTKLSNTTKYASAQPLEYSMDGVSATVNGVAAPMLFVTPGIVSIQVPYEVGAGPGVVGLNNNGQIAAFPIQVAPAAPAIMTEFDGTVAGRPVGKRGGYVTLYVTGWGDVTPALLTGFSPTTTVVTSLPKPLLGVSVTVGGVPVFVQFAAVGKGLIGTGQINILLPQTVPTGDQPVVVTMNGVSSPAATVNVQ